MVVDIWQEFLKIVREEVGSRVVETWLKAVKLRQWDAQENTLFLEAPNTFVRDWICSNYMPLFQLHLGRLLHVEKPRVIVTTALEQEKHQNYSEKEHEQVPDAHATRDGQDTHVQSVKRAQYNTTHTKDATSSAQSFRTVQATHTPLQTREIRALSSDSQARAHFLPAQHTAYQAVKLNPNYRFETFVVGSHNSLAYAAACAIAQDPGNQYNPFLMYGGSGLGKTHLLHAIGNEIQKNNPHAFVLYQTTDRFINEFISAIRFNKTHIFQQKYRSIDVLLIDDIQFISHKEQTQEAFFHIFNVLYDAKKQIIFSSDIFPRHIQGLEERLRSRLEWGLVADIHKPQLETKIAIVKKKAALYNEQISDDAAQIIAQQATSNIRELEGALVRVLAFASLTKQHITYELVCKVLSQEPIAQEESVDFSRITASVCKHYSYKLSDLRSDDRSKELSFARQIAMYLMKKMTGKSLKEIGGFLGRKNHSTVLHACDKIIEAVEKDPLIKTIVHNLETEILR